MSETESRVDLADIGKGWQAVMSGTHWNGSMQEIKGVEVECVGPIKPKDKPDVEPDRFMFRLPRDFENSELRGKIIVFSAEDVDRWVAPEPDSPR